MVKNYPTNINEEDKNIIINGNIAEYFSLSPDTCKYTKNQINKYIEGLWSKSLQNEFNMQGHSMVPRPTCSPLVISRDISRDVEVLIMSLLYPNNLLNLLMHSYNSGLYQSPLCSCGIEEQTPNHLLYRCSLIDNDLRAESYSYLKHSIGTDAADVDHYITILNASRDERFMHTVGVIMELQRDNLRLSVEL